ncbi:TetR/AcrR family transcriptional regulator [Streptomyces sp. N2-109]|uniref:TetR/AcrR family transcriptional regulator n=1 Tax=Streptomyces gossypii TaxID=2883101 RepID=A0ABT2JWB9_9ACTN|nr:TetR/AcrR family transcriptional regulator [Streptomyces gossypii]MCT2592200.1 TetR/AcrR family transcriptional regulator [Streptomyces gossypii]
MVRMSADERRESVIRAALTEFGHGGYEGTSTEAIARRVGVSQPYLFRLFPGKRAIFLAAVSRGLSEVRLALEAAARDAPAGEERVHAMGAAYQQLISANPDVLLIQAQAHVAVAAAERSGDHELGRRVRGEWLEIWDAVHLQLGADAGETTQFLGYGMLTNTLVLMGFPAEHRVWGGFYVAVQPPPESEPQPQCAPQVREEVPDTRTG